MEAAEKWQIRPHSSSLVVIFEDLFNFHLYSFTLCFRKKAVIEQKDYHFLTGTLSELAKNRYCVEIIGAARPDASSGKKKPPPPSSGAPIPETASIPEEEPPEVLFNAPASPTPIASSAEVDDDDHPSDSKSDCSKIADHAKQRESNRKRKKSGSFK